MPTILDDLKLRLGAFSAIFRPATLTADRVLTVPDKTGTLLVDFSTLTAQSNFTGISSPVTIANVNAAIGYGAQASFQLGDGTNLYNSGGIASRQETAFTSTASTQNAYLAFSSLLAGNVTEKVRISAAGNLMIGTTTDDGNRLQISGNLYASGSISLFGSNINSGSSLAINASVASSKQLLWRATNLNRWNLFTQGAGETGGDAGSPIVLSYYTDAGGYKADLFQATRLGVFTISASTTRFTGANLGFFSATAIAKPTVTGSKASGAALASLLTALSSLGLITDSTTA